MKNKALYIGLGVAALAVVGFLAFRKKQGSADDMATKSAGVDSEMDETEAAKGTALSSLAKPAKATAPSKEVSTPKVPTTATAPAASSNDVLFLAYGISQKDYDKMIAQKDKISKEADDAQLPAEVKNKVVRDSLVSFANKNQISFKGFKRAFIAKNPSEAMPVESVADAPTRRDCRAEAEAAVANTPRILRAAKKLALIAKCKAEGGFAADGGDEFAFSFADDTYDLFS